MPYGSPRERIAQVEATVAAVRAAAPEVPVLIAGSGPRMLRLAGGLSDTVALGLATTSGSDEFARAVDAVRAGADGRADAVRICLNMVAVGDAVHPWVARSGVSAEILRESGSVLALWGDPGAMAERVESLRVDYGVSYVCTSVDFAETLAPVVEQLAGR